LIYTTKTVTDIITKYAKHKKPITLSSPISLTKLKYLAMLNTIRDKLFLSKTGF